MNSRKLFLFLAISILTPNLFAESAKTKAIDLELAENLKQELNHDASRRKGFSSFQNSIRNNDNERERGLTDFIIQKEKWDKEREQGLAAYRKQKLKEGQNTLEEGSPEHRAFLDKEKQREIQREKDRLIQIETKKRVLAQIERDNIQPEYAELGLINNRPRYDLRKRGANKWVKSGSSMAGSSGGGSSSNSNGNSTGSPSGTSGAGFGGSNFDDYLPPPPPPLDYAPMPTEEFENVPLPPSPFDSAPGFMDNGGDMPPPPPPPVGGWDF